MLALLHLSVSTDGLKNIDKAYSAAEQREEHEIYDLGDFKLANGSILPDAKIAYKTWGTLDAEKSNAIVYPTWYSGKEVVVHPVLAITWMRILTCCCMIISLKTIHRQIGMDCR